MFEETVSLDIYLKVWWNSGIKKREMQGFSCFQNYHSFKSYQKLNEKNLDIFICIIYVQVIPFHCFNVVLILFIEYCKTRAVPSVKNSNYLNTLGEELHKDVNIMWTGK